MTILVTGAAGFIGFHVCQALLSRGEKIFGIDNLNDYYNPALKRARLEQLQENASFSFAQCDIADKKKLDELLQKRDVNNIVHLAAQAGVRHSLKAPFSYTESNVTGHLSILELARKMRVQHMVYASSSSIYGRNIKTPFRETDPTDEPASLYGATKKANELMASSYAHLYQIPLTGLRFFTVYGPWGRPDMAYWMFTDDILAGNALNIFNHGRMARDFTYIDDIVDGVLGALGHPPGSDTSYHQLFNLGNDHPENLMTLISLLEERLGLPAKTKMMDMQPGDVEQTWADISAAKEAFGFSPKIPLKEGLQRFVDWRVNLQTKI